MQHPELIEQSEIVGALRIIGVHEHEYEGRAFHSYSLAGVARTLSGGSRLLTSFTNDRGDLAAVGDRFALRGGVLVRAYRAAAPVESKAGEPVYTAIALDPSQPVQWARVGLAGGNPAMRPTFVDETADAAEAPADDATTAQTIADRALAAARSRA